MKLLALFNAKYVQQLKALSKQLMHWQIFKVDFAIYLKKQKQLFHTQTEDVKIAAFQPLPEEIAISVIGKYM